MYESELKVRFKMNAFSNDYNPKVHSAWPKQQMKYFIHAINTEHYDPASGFMDIFFYPLNHCCLYGISERPRRSYLNILYLQGIVESYNSRLESVYTV